MMSDEPTVLIVDDDQAICDSLRFLIESVGLHVATYGSAKEFLAGYDPARPGCLVLDVRMPGVSGLELLDKMSSYGISKPVIVITGHADVPMAVRAMKAGVVDFIEKPFNDQVLLDRIQEAIEQDRQARRQRSEREQTESKLAVLTPREHQVMALVVIGKANKQVAAELDLSQKTVEAHRARVMEKMGVDSLAGLVRLAVLAELLPGEP